jgi:hypothetical protein
MLVEAKVKGWIAEGRVLKALWAKRPYLLFSEEPDDDGLRELLRLGLYADKSFRVGAWEEFDKAVHHARDNWVTRRSTLVRLSLRSAEEASKFLVLAPKNCQFSHFIDENHPQSIFVFVPYKTTPEINHYLNHLLFSHKIADPIADERISIVAEPGSESIRAYNQMLDINKLLSLKLELERSLGTIDLGKNLLPALSEFSRVLSSSFPESEKTFEGLIESLANQFAIVPQTQKKEVCLKALQHIREDKTLSQFEIQRYLSVIQDLILHASISNAHERELFSRKRANNLVPRSLSDAVVLKLLKLQERPELPVAYGSEFKGLFELVGGSGGLSYVVFNLRHTHYRSTALLISEKDELDVVLLDPLNITRKRISEYEMLHKTYQHILNVLSIAAPGKRLRFYTFDLVRQRDNFNCATYYLADYNAVHASMGDIVAAVSKLKFAATAEAAASLSTLTPIPIPLAMSTQSLTQLAAFNAKLAEEVTDQFGRRASPERKKPRNAYILLKLAEYVEELVKTEVIFKG